MEEKKLSKREQKKYQQYQERRQRLINDGINEENVDAVIAQQDYTSLPTDKKIQRLEMILRQSFTQIGQDIESLRHNDLMIADAMDINMRSMSKCLTKVGVPLEEQKTIIEDVQREMAEAHRQLVEDRRKREEEAEAQKLHAVLSQEAKPEDAGSPVVPAEATVFGG